MCHQGGISLIPQKCVNVAHKIKLLDPNMMKSAFNEFPKLHVSSPHFSVYIDGYDLYQAINHAKPEQLLRLGWCNYQRLGELLASFCRKTHKNG